MSKPKTIMIDEIEYVRADSVANVPAGDRMVVVVDRGWIFAGDIDPESPEGFTRLLNAIHVRRWEKTGFDGLCRDPAGAQAVLKDVNVVEIPAGSVICRVPVDKNWGK